MENPMRTRFVILSAILVLDILFLNDGKAADSKQISFRDATSSSKISFVHHNGASEKKYMPETVGSGACILDYDNDLFQDILLINGMSLSGLSASQPGTPSSSVVSKQNQSTPALYRNIGDGTFKDVTHDLGLDVQLYGMGCAIGDYDNDGWMDIYITGLGDSRLFHRIAHGKFIDVTKNAGLLDTGWSTGAAWLDYDRDGDLDLFVAHYVQWSIQDDIWCTYDGQTKAYCGPELYQGESSRLYQNNGNGTFSDVTKQAGLYNSNGKSLGVALLDFNRDGWLDIVVANDTVPNFLYRNNKDGTFTDMATLAGVAYGAPALGEAKAGMGIDVADYNNQGSIGILIGNFSSEMLSLYTSQDGKFFKDHATKSKIAQPSRLFLTFGLFFFDYDLDGFLDFLTANGHIDGKASHFQKDVTYEQRPQLYRNLGNGTFLEVGSNSGKDLMQPVVGRGAAYGDFDNDGDLDFILTVNGGRPRLFENKGGNNHHALKIKVIGTKSNRDGVGTQVKVKVRKHTITQMVKTGSSYLSQSELPLTFGLAQNPRADQVEVTWPNGQTEVFKNVKANLYLTIQEGKGIISSKPFE